MRIGLVGIGTLGTAIGLRLCECGIELAVWNRSSYKTHDLSRQGATIAGSVLELLQGCRLVIVCLSDVQAFESAFAGSLESKVGGQTILINTSTIGTLASCKLERMVRDAGLEYWDMPVSGGPQGARAGTLTAYIAERAVQNPQIGPLLHCLATRIVACRDNEAAQTMKVLNNLCEAVNLWGAAEAVALGRRVGFSDHELREGLPAGRGDSRYLRVLLDSLDANSEQVDVALSIRCKDLVLAAELGKEHDLVGFPLSEIVTSLFLRTAASFGSGADQCRCLDFVEVRQVDEPGHGAFT